MREMSGIVTVTRLIEKGKIKDSGFDPVNFHMIQAESAMSKLGVSSKFNADWEFLRHLHDLGVETADKWLRDHFDAIGNTSTLDINAYE
jgi:NTE family protein